jgi:hypothetical protein
VYNNVVCNLEQFPVILQIYSKFFSDFGWIVRWGSERPLPASLSQIRRTLPQGNSHIRSTTCPLPLPSPQVRWTLLQCTIHSMSTTCLSFPDPLDSSKRVIAISGPLTVSLSQIRWTLPQGNSHLRSTSCFSLPNPLDSTTGQ